MKLFITASNDKLVANNDKLGSFRVIKFPLGKHWVVTPWVTLELIFLCMVMIGCKSLNRTQSSGTYIAPITDAPVPIKDVPSAPAYDSSDTEMLSYVGHINGFKRLGVNTKADSTAIVYIRRADNIAWEELEPLQVGGKPGYTLEASNHELRFQNCKEGWTYAVFILNYKTSLY